MVNNPIRYQPIPITFSTLVEKVIHRYSKLGKPKNNAELKS